VLTTNVRPGGDTQARLADQVPPSPAGAVDGRRAADAASVNGAVSMVAVITMALVAVTAGASG
jgi:hypothetical protein